jgi:hypothetical protein
MRKINYILSNTPFVNGTYDFYATTAKDKVVDQGHYYTPTTITGWRYKKYRRTAAKSNALHEISHIIDLYEREQKERLLKPNFGWALTNRDNSIPREWMMVEVGTVCIQKLITEAFVKAEFVAPIDDYELMDVYNSMTSTPFASTKREWRKIFKPVQERVNDNGLQYHLDIWEKASAYVRENR